MLLSVLERAGYPKSAIIPSLVGGDPEHRSFQPVGRSRSINSPKSPDEREAQHGTPARKQLSAEGEARRSYLQSLRPGCGQSVADFRA